MNKILDLKTILEMGDQKDEGHHINVIFLIKVNVLQKSTDRNAIGLEICRAPAVLSGGTSSGLFTFSSLDTANRMVQAKHLTRLLSIKQRVRMEREQQGVPPLSTYRLWLEENPSLPKWECVCFPRRLTMCWL